MASSSVSQEDVENDFEKLEKRSRIRTARARQINPQVSNKWFGVWTSRAESNCSHSIAGMSSGGGEAGDLQ